MGRIDKTRKALIHMEVGELVKAVNAARRTATRAGQLMNAATRSAAMMTAEQELQLARQELQAMVATLKKVHRSIEPRRTKRRPRKGAK